MSRLLEALRGDEPWKEYPDHPGAKVSTGPSPEAATKMARGFRTLQARTLAELGKAPGTADEIADRLGVNFLSVRPRIAELRRLGKIRPTQTRRVNDSGMTATVWEVKPTGVPVEGGDHA